MMQEVSLTHLPSTHKKIGLQLQQNMELKFGKFHLKRKQNSNNQLLH